MPITENTAVRRPPARERLARAVLHLSARRRAEEEGRLRRASLRQDLVTHVTEDPRFWRLTTPQQRLELLQHVNADRVALGQEPWEELPDPRLAELASLFHRQCVQVQRGVPAEPEGEPCLEPFLEEAAHLFGEDFLAEQNVNLHNHLLVAQMAKQEQARQAKLARPGHRPEGESGTEAPGPLALPDGGESAGPVGSWRENYRRLLARYAVVQASPEARRGRFHEQLVAWRRLHQDHELRADLAGKFLAALLRESAALGLGWTAETLLAYAHGPAALEAAPEATAPDFLARLEHLHAQLAAAQHPQSSLALREAARAELLRGLFGLDEATAAGLGGLPPVLQLAVLRNQGAVIAADVKSKSAWERGIFARLVPHPLEGGSPEARRKCQEGTRVLARDTWRYFHTSEE